MLQTSDRLGKNIGINYFIPIRVNPNLYLIKAQQFDFITPSQVSYTCRGVEQSGSSSGS